MTKNELLNKIADVYAGVDELVSSIERLKNDAKDIRSLLEEFPEEVSEITDDEKEVKIVRPQQIPLEIEDAE